MLKLNSISPSRIKTFDMCKFKYWLTYHCPGVVLKSNWGAAHGSLLHDILENLSNEKDIDWVSRLYRGYAGKLETLDRKGNPTIMETPLRWAKAADFKDKKPRCDTCPFATSNGLCSISQEKLDKLTGCPKGLFEKSVSMLEDTIDRYQSIWPKILKKDGVLVGTEYAFNITVPGTDVPMFGIMDLVIEEDEDTIHIMDYKTGTWTQTYEECREDIQVRMYSLAARREFIDDVSKKGYKYKNIILTFDYFTQNPIMLALSKEDDDKTEKYVADKIKEIQSTQWINRIVKNDDQFAEKSAWKCRSLCDTSVCSSQWKGRFNTNEQSK